MMPLLETNIHLVYVDYIFTAIKVKNYTRG